MKNQKDIDAFEDAWHAVKHRLTSQAPAHFERRRALLTAFQVSSLDPIFRARTRNVKPPAPNRLYRVLFDLESNVSIDWVKLIKRNPETALLAMHAPDGYLREYAIKRAQITDTAALSLLLLRCNDWVIPVQKAAHRRLNELLPALNEEALAPICLFVLNRSLNWQRGGALAAQNIMAQPLWPKSVICMFKSTTNGPLTLSLRELLRTKDFDWALPELATEAKSAFVRAVAVNTLLTGYARWFEKFEWEWHDKAFGLRHKVPHFAKRHLEVSHEIRAKILSIACCDKSPKVRILAADYLIEFGPKENKHLINTLKMDKSKAVQERMAFFNKKWLGRES